MANVVDPDLWRSLAMAKAGNQVQKSQVALAPREKTLLESWPLGGMGSSRLTGRVGLAIALHQLFDNDRDRVIWTFERTISVAPGETGDSARVDPSHDVPRPSNTIHGAPRSSTSIGNDATGIGSWLVIVDQTSDLILGDAVDRLGAIAEQIGRLLLIVCETGDVGGATSSEASSKMRSALLDASQQLQWEHVGPIAGDDLELLVQTLAKIKILGRPTLMHVKTRSAEEHNECSGENSADAGEQAVRGSNDLGVGSFLQVAAEHLASCARRDTRILSVSTSAEPFLMAAWESMPRQAFRVETDVPSALQWCGHLALEGNRPVAFISSDELQEGFGQLRRDVCGKRAAVTLVVEPRGSKVDDALATSGCLAAVRQLPNLSLMSPKDGMELAQMLSWCLAQDDPAVVWLPQSLEQQTPWGRGPEIESGQAESLSSGGQVAVIAWGPMVAAARAAAEVLAQHGIALSVINARFAQPLDIARIKRAAQEALCVLLLDDAGSRGGFAVWVLEELLRHGVVQPIAIVTPSRHASSDHPHDLQRQCAIDIIDRCRWLADRFEPQNVGLDVADAGDMREPSRASSWLRPLEEHSAFDHDEHRQVLALQLSPFIDGWVREYMKVGARGVYLWRWCLHGLELITLSCVEPTLRREHCETKLLAVMFGVMLDDIADQGGDEDFLNELTKVIGGLQQGDFRRFPSDQRDYARFTVNLWQSLESRLKHSPFYHEYEELLEYDHRQILNTMKYSSMVNRHPAMLNLQEHDIYLPHNMQMMSFATMDLMCSPAFDRRELGKLREVIWHAQSMGRIGNLVSTWQREIADRDFTSGVFARALTRGDLTLEDLAKATPNAIEAAVRRGGHESYFLQQWETHRQCIRAMVSSIRSVDMNQLLTALGRLIRMELSSRGFK